MKNYDNTNNVFETWEKCYVMNEDGTHWIPQLAECPYSMLVSKADIIEDEPEHQARIADEDSENMSMTLLVCKSVRNWGGDFVN